MPNTVRELMTADPVCLDSQATISEAAQEMADRDIGDILVLDGDDLVGIVTDRDIVVRALARHLDPEQSTLSEILSGDMVTIAPDDSLDRAVQLMRTRALRRLPVCAGNEPIGMLSIGDLAEARDPNSALADISSARANR